ncbi:MAG TPA: hypothetical protein VM364_00665 [Vicinamibacterales bacterium]|nr:hypothetical protein [Vicinamibacterales bacterium]
MKPHTIHLGYEVGTGDPVAIPLKHLVITGMTQEAGKTTALEALISRAPARAITFVTKRGEGAFAGGRRIPPFFRERADWVFVSSLIDATLGEKNKLLRSWLMKVCRNTSTLAEVLVNVRTAKASARGFSESIYTEIEGYLELVVPQLRRLPAHTSLTIGEGLNVMDLSPYSTELQALVIRSVLEHVYAHERDVITVIPEAWEFIPEGRGTPVKREAEVLIRKGASLGNYVWIDSQDLAGVWKTVVRAAAVCLVGVQREANEIKRTLANIPGGIAKPKAADVATLELGQFYVCHGRHAVKTYVQPAWMPLETARLIATGTVTVADAIRSRAFVNKLREEEQVNAAEAERIRQESQQLARDNETLRRENDDLRRRIDALESSRRSADQRHQDPRREPGDQSGAGGNDAGSAASARTDHAAGGTARQVQQIAGATPLTNDALYAELLARLVQDAAKDPVLLRVIATKPELEVLVERKMIQMDGSSLKGRVARLIAEGFFREPRTQGATRSELKRTGPDVNSGNLSRAFSEFVRDGFLTDEGSVGYREVAGMKTLGDVRRAIRWLSERVSVAARSIEDVLHNERERDGHVRVLQQAANVLEAVTAAKSPSST